MLVVSAKLKGKTEQYQALDEAILSANFVRNKALRYWMDKRGVKKYDLNKHCAVLAQEFEWANRAKVQWPGKLVQNEHGVRFLVFLITAKKIFQAKKAIQNSRQAKF